MIRCEEYERTRESFSSVTKIQSLYEHLQSHYQTLGNFVLNVHLTRSSLKQANLRPLQSSSITFKATPTASFFQPARTHLPLTKSSIPPSQTPNWTTWLENNLLYLHTHPHIPTTITKNRAKRVGNHSGTQSPKNPSFPGNRGDLSSNREGKKRGTFRSAPLFPAIRTKWCAGKRVSPFSTLDSPEYGAFDRVYATKEVNIPYSTVHSRPEVTRMDSRTLLAQWFLHLLKSECLSWILLFIHESLDVRLNRDADEFVVWNNLYRASTCFAG